MIFSFFLCNFANKFKCKMDNYIVSARKYRPMTFNSVVGQSALTATLKNSIVNGHLAHAYLFCGPRGVGKTTCARIFAKTINCLDLDANGEPCGKCESCKAFDEQRSLNIHELDAASNNGIEDIRALIEQTRIPPQVGKYKVFIIDEVHMLSLAAFNAFLKTLEEPPHYVIFILATTEKHKLLPTILSRCQIYDFNRMSVNDIVTHLTDVAKKENIQVESSALNVIAEKADGGMRDALSIFDQVAAFCNGNITYDQTLKNLNVLDSRYYFHLVDCFLEGKIPEVMVVLNDIINKGFDPNHFILGLNSHFRNLLMSKDQQTISLIEASDDIRAKYGEQAKKCKPAFIYAAIRKCTDCDLNYKISQNRRLLVEITLIEIAQLASEDTPDSGRSPKRILKPLFKKRGAADASSSKVGHAIKTDKTMQPVASPKAAVVPNATTARQASVQSVTRHIGVTGFSINQMENKLSAAAAAQNATSSVTPSVSEIKTPNSVNNQPFTIDELAVAWRMYSRSIDTANRALAVQLDKLRPTQIGDTMYEVVVDNPILMSQMKSIMYDAITYLRKQLKNDLLNIKVRMREVKERQVILTRTEQLAKMKENNPALKKLVEELNLELI